METDDLNFFDDPTPETPAVETPAVSEPAPQATPSVDPAVFEQQQRELDSLKRWQQDVSRVFGPQPQQPQPDPTQHLQEFVQDPLGWKQKIKEEATQEAVNLAIQQVQNQQIIEDRRAKYPHLADFEEAIASERNTMAAAAAFRQKNGRDPANFAELLDASIEHFQSKLQSAFTNVQQQQQGDALKKQALNFNLTGQGQAPAGAPDPFKMSDADWTAYRQNLGY